MSLGVQVVTFLFLFVYGFIYFLFFLFFRRKLLHFNFVLGFLYNLFFMLFMVFIFLFFLIRINNGILNCYYLLFFGSGLFCSLLFYRFIYRHLKCKL